MSLIKVKEYLKKYNKDGEIVEENTLSYEDITKRS